MFSYDESGLGQSIIGCCPTFVAAKILGQVSPSLGRKSRVALTKRLR